MPAHYQNNKNDNYLLLFIFISKLNNCEHHRQFHKFCIDLCLE